MSMWLATSDVLPTTRVEGRLGALRFRSVASQLPRNVWSGSGAVIEALHRATFAPGTHLNLLTPLFCAAKRSRVHRTRTKSVHSIERESCPG